ncbi:MAG: helix-turn-helix transcriptional regulator [Actinobacteria bacterium]|nr:MAG: helix-turn-helix transcriptional regulator [Actinomycetota bacterium]
MAGSRPAEAHHDDQLCSIAASLQLIGDRWSLLILRDAFRGVRRFDELATDQQRPVRYEYRLSAKGVDLSPALVALMRWGDKHVLGESPPVVLVHDRCGTPLEQTLTCPECAQAVTPRAIKSRPGPGALAPSKATKTMKTKAMKTTRRSA